MKLTQAQVLKIRSKIKSKHSQDGSRFLVSLNRKAFDLILERVSYHDLLEYVLQFPLSRSYSEFDCQPWYSSTCKRIGKFRVILSYSSGHY